MGLAVGQRRHEIGVRMAIGARPGEILRMVLGQGMVLALFGVALGFVGALALTGLLERLLFEVGPTDPPTFVGVAVVLAAAAWSRRAEASLFMSLSDGAVTARARCGIGRDGEWAVHDYLADHDLTWRIKSLPRNTGAYVIKENS